MSTANVIYNFQGHEDLFRSDLFAQINNLPPNLSSGHLYNPTSADLVDGKREYIVIAHDGCLESLEQDLELDTTANNEVDGNIVPDRPVEVANRRITSDIQTHYWLTDQEAANLQSDPRVRFIHPTIEYDTGLALTQFGLDYQPYYSFESRYNVLRQSINYPGGARNWALHLCGNGNVDYGSGLTSPSDDRTYRYILDGDGVDVVISDGGLDPSHPEWLDPTGRFSRFQRVNWYTLAGISGAQATALQANINNGTYYQSDDGGHGMHVASIAAGRVFGWAKKANIYNMKFFGFGATSVTDGLDLIRLWHKNKPIDPKTGRKRPTIVNGSWGLSRYVIVPKQKGYEHPSFFPGSTNKVFNGVTPANITYRGTNIGTIDLFDDVANTGLNGTATLDNYSMGSNSSGVPITGRFFGFNGQDAGFDTATESMINEGVIFVHAAGNSHHKLDVPGGPDYDNSVSVWYTPISFLPPTFQASYYYHRPSSPDLGNVIHVGSVNSICSQKPNILESSPFSAWGPGVTVWAPGSAIVAAYSAKYGNLPAVDDFVYKNPTTGAPVAGNVMVALSGTSMAAPQVTGFLALYLQANPAANQLACLQWLQNVGSNSNLLYTGNVDDYANAYIVGDSGKFMYTPWKTGVATQSTQDNIEGSLVLENLTINTI